MYTENAYGPNGLLLEVKRESGDLDLCRER